MDLYVGGEKKTNPAVDDLECIIKVRYNKGTKHSPTEFLVKRIGTLPKPEWNLLCVVKLIIIAAFRYIGVKSFLTFLFFLTTNEHLNSPTPPLYAHLVLK